MVVLGYDGRSRDSTIIKPTCRFLDADAYSGRPYRWFGTKDFDGDGKQEMVILAALKKHLDVLD